MHSKMIAIVLAACATLPAFGADTCRPIRGKIQLTPDPTCGVVAAYPGNAYIGAMGVPGTCFNIELTGLGKGYAGMTAEAVYGMDMSRSVSPLSAFENGVPQLPTPSPFPQTHQIFTARTYIKTNDGDIINGAEVGVIGQSGATEQSTLVGGTGQFAGAKGHLFAYGDYLGAGKWGKYEGEICVTGDKSHHRKEHGDRDDDND